MQYIDGARQIPEYPIFGTCNRRNVEATTLTFTRNRPIIVIVASLHIGVILDEL